VRGASLLGVAIGVFVVGVAATVAVPLAQKAWRKARAARVVADLNAFAGAFQLEFKQRADWPPAATVAGRAPAGMESALGAAWSRRTPIGGRYLWAPDTLQRGRRLRATIVLWSLPDDPVLTDRKLLEEIDREIDDGNLAEGRFQLGYRDQPLFVIAP
jgi:type II secretory pathway pseudopilin PulG